MSKGKITAGRRGRKDRARYYIDDTEGSQPEFEEFNESVDFAGGNMIHTLYTPPQQDSSYREHWGNREPEGQGRQKTNKIRRDVDTKKGKTNIEYMSRGGTGKVM